MTNGSAALIASIVIASAWGCADGGQITGEIVVAPCYSGQGVFAALFQYPATQSDNGLVPTGQAVALGYLAVGIAGDSQQSFKYVFHGIPTGLYYVGAFLWNNEGAGPDFDTDVKQIDVNATLTVDPDVPSQATVVHDVYLGMSEPGTGTISGTVHIGAPVGTAPVQVLLMTGNPYTTQPQFLDEQPVSPGDGGYELFNVPSSPVYVMAWADTNNNGAIDFETDQFAFAPSDPVSGIAGAVDGGTSACATEPTAGADMWLEAQDPSKGSVQGTIQLSAPLRQSTISVLAFSSNYEQNAGANVIGVANVSGTDTATIPFELYSMPVGTLYLYAIIETPGFVTAQAMGQVAYTGASIATLLPVQLTTAQPNATSVSFPVGVGRVTGMLSLSGVPNDVAVGWVTATQPIAGSPFIAQYTEVTLSGVCPSQMVCAQSPCVCVPYEVFGLLDGTYQLTFVPDTRMTGDLVTDLDDGATGVAGSPASVTIAGGGPAVSNFAYDFPQN